MSHRSDTYHQSKRSILILSAPFIMIIVSNVISLVLSNDTYLSSIWLGGLFFSIYLCIECVRYSRRTDGFGLLSPVLLASYLHFYIGYLAATAVSDHYPWVYSQFFPYMGSDPAGALMFSLECAFLACFSMWRGYEFLTPAASRISKYAGSLKLRKDGMPTVGLCIFLILLYLISNLILARQGLLSVASSVEDRVVNQDVQEYVNLLKSAGPLAIFFIFLLRFRAQSSNRSGSFIVVLSYLFVFIQEILGAVSGFKSAMIAPFLVINVAYYWEFRKVSLFYVACVPVMLLVSYSIVEPYRIYLRNNPELANAGVESLIAAMFSATQQIDSGSVSTIPVPVQIAARSDLLGISSVALSFEESQTVDKELKEKMIESLYLSPVLAFVPRIISSSKPTYSTGNWVTRIIFGRDEDLNTSIGIGPVMWIYYVGGLIGIVIAFFSIGALQAFIFEGIARTGLGGFIVYLSCASSLITIPTDFGLTLIGIIRIIPIAIFAQYFILTNRRRTDKRVAPRRPLGRSVID